MTLKLTSARVRKGKMGLTSGAFHGHSGWLGLEAPTLAFPKKALATNEGQLEKGGQGSGRWGRGEGERVRTESSARIVAVSATSAGVK